MIFLELPCRHVTRTAADNKRYSLSRKYHMELACSKVINAEGQEVYRITDPAHLSWGKRGRPQEEA